MLIIIFALLSYFSPSDPDNIDSYKNNSVKQIQILKNNNINSSTSQEKEKTKKTVYPFGVSLFSDFNKNYPIDNSDTLVYGLSFSYQISSAFKITALIGDTHINNIPASDEISNEYKDNGVTYGINGDFNYIYKSLYSAIYIDLLHTNMNETKDFNIFKLTPRIGYINNSRNFKGWIGAMYSYENQDFDINIEDSILVPAIGIEYTPIPQLELSSELRFKNDYQGINLKVTYKF